MHKPGTLVQIKAEQIKQHLSFGKYKGVIGEVLGCKKTMGGGLLLPDSALHDSLCIFVVFFHGAEDQCYYLARRFDILWEPES